jgi:hypothetical protein
MTKVNLKYHSLDNHHHYISVLGAVGYGDYNDVGLDDDDK